MDILKAELERKKKKLLSSSLPSSNNAPGKKVYLRRGEIEQINSTSPPSEDVSAGKIEDIIDGTDTVTTENVQSESVTDVIKSDARQDEGGNESTLSREEVKSRLRACGEPVTLFGESDSDRIARLRVWEERNANTDLALGGGHEISNPFLRDSNRRVRGTDNIDVVDESEYGRDSTFVLRDSESSANNRKRGRSSGRIRSFDEFFESLERQVRKVNKDRPDQGEHEFVGRVFETILEEAEHELTCRSEEEEETAEGKNYTKIVLQTRDYLRSFFRLCRKRSIPKDILTLLKDIVDGIMDRNYREAGDAYMKLAVGNAPWLIGVSQVGLHERAARQKIYVGKIDHVMNDESQRKYITCLKRLISFVQDKDVTVDDSKKLRS